MQEIGIVIEKFPNIEKAVLGKNPYIYRQNENIVNTKQHMGITNTFIPKQK